jgi:ATP-dependent DNA helicase RecG
MTATPIPRTVAMTVFGDLEVSTLTELPVGRQPITSYVVPEDRPAFLARAWERIREEVSEGRQAYVVCPRIGGDEAEIGTEPEPEDEGSRAPRRPARAVLDVLPELADGPLAGLRVEMLHGRMPSEAKDDVMRRFSHGEVDVLVATTVVEVGVDVPNATVMVVLDADRFGVSQLHQLRGRVGRGESPALCLLVTEVAEDSPPRERVAAVAATQDGFALSRLDLQARREGDVLGATQAGRRSSLRLLSVLRDERVIESARDDAILVIADDPALVEFPALRGALVELIAENQAEFLDKS